MKSKNTPKVSRRHFLEAAVVTAAAHSVSAAAETTEPVRKEQADAKRFADIVATYGSELGDLRKVT